MLNSVAWRVQSNVLTGAQITEVLGAEPTRVTRIGDPVNACRLDGPRRAFTTWQVEISVTPDTEFSDVFAGSSVYERFDQVRAIDPDVQTDLICMLDASLLGAMHTISPRDIARLASAGCGLTIDVYNNNDDE